ncbi:MAG: VacJ family lipoprotein [Desulfobacula sp.]|uniref:MlaA family lipoprotein n=1 Tax=Desulfobacula sp. TaxID=2593537 RepID=UPI0025C6292D|nr:VacJ family lipoprotein [Desulfobacula sp.]MCD4719597.1 VacJ family lipoprotein [Desulfobacula sp.]
MNSAKRPVEDYVKKDVKYEIKQIYDPWEAFNRGMYKFNAQFDNYIFLPVLKTYKFILPDFAETGVSNFFNNIDEIFTLANSILQLKVEKSCQTAGRFIINSTVGILGLVDVATSMGIPVQDEDFGQTLGFYGVGQGPYWVVPIFGPSNLRDFFGIVLETAAFVAVDPFNFDVNHEYEIPYTMLEAIDTRNQINFRYYMTGSPFEYDMIRLLYDKSRILKIEN